MNEFFQYVKELFIKFCENFVEFFRLTFAEPWTNVVTHDFADYTEIFNTYSPGFGTGGWILFVLYWLIIGVIVGAIIFLIVKLIIKYIHFTKREGERQELLEQVEKLNYELYKAVDEKNKILNLKVDALGGKLPEEEQEEEKKTDDGIDCRFAKLSAVDEKYKSFDATVHMEDADMLTLEQLCERFRLFAASQLHLYYELKVMRNFWAGMGASKLLILEGISGTGKTSLPYAMGKYFQSGAKICSVQPSWRDRSELVGYYNEFTHHFNETEFLKAIYECTFREDCNILILDEMNLARIEYYFAEFLSIMEMPNHDEWLVELIGNPDPETDPIHIKDGKLLIPQNIWFIGTANNDDSTFTITDKVYDRAISLFLNNKGIAFDADFAEPVNLSYEYLNKLYKEALTNYPVSNKMLEKFEKLDTFVIANFKLAFGNRIMKQLKLFVPCYVACGGTEMDGFDYIFTTKILKKFESLNIGFLKDELRNLLTELDKLFGKGTFPDARKYIEGLIKMSA
ncbi:MAG: hypothetical protein HUJ61_07400 [Bacilli bacterium]|nr:hypothetical protein [Bacilli bacterium]